MDKQEQELLELVKSLATKVDQLEVEIKALKMVQQVEIPEETMVAIAAAVSAYLGYRAKRRQVHFSTARNWQSQTRRSQQVHTPLYLREA